MKIKNISVITLALSLFFLACTNSKKENQSVKKKHEVKYPIVIDLDNTEENKDEKTYTSSIFKPNVKTIILETRKEILIGRIDKLQVYNDYLIILDYAYSKKIYVFNTDGKFIRNIGNQGNGPEEYSSVNDFSIDEKNGEVLLLDGNKQKIMRYQIKTGKYLKSKEIKIENKESTISRSIEYYNSKLYADVYCFMEKDDTPLLRELDPSSGKQVRTFFKLKEYNKRSHRYLLTEFPFKRYNPSSLLFFHPFMSTVIRIDNNGVEPLITIKGKDIFTTKELMQYDLDNPLNDFGMKILFIDKIGGINFCYEYKDLIDLSYSQGTKGKSVRYNKSTDKATYSTYILDDLVYRNVEKSVLFKPEFATNKGIYSVISGTYFPGFIKIKNSGGLNAGIDKSEQLMTLTEDSNPVIFYYEFKK